MPKPFNNDYIVRHGDCDYRYETPRGVERRHRILERYFSEVTPMMLAAMTPDELRAVADCIDGRDTRGSPHAQA